MYRIPTLENIRKVLFSNAVGMELTSGQKESSHHHHHRLDALLRTYLLCISHKLEGEKSERFWHIKIFRLFRVISEVQFYSIQQQYCVQILKGYLKSGDFILTLREKGQCLYKDTGICLKMNELYYLKNKLKSTTVCVPVMFCKRKQLPRATQKYYT